MFVTDAERIEKLERSVDEYKTLVRLLQEENERLKRGLLGQKAERFSTNGARISGIPGWSRASSRRTDERRGFP
jgi:hypothetical protein